MRNIVGNKEKLYNNFGNVDISKCIGSIFSKIGDVTIDINQLNAVAETGALYVQANGKILDTYTEADESKAKYRIIPTGLVLKGTRFPIFASFLKFESNKQWQGVYLGTGEELFKMYKEHYYDKTCFDNQYINVFCGPGAYMDILGFGLKQVIKNNAQAKYEEESRTIYKSDDSSDKALTDMRQAIQKCLEEAKNQDSSTKGKRIAKKAMDKANMLKQRLEKMEAKHNKQESEQICEFSENTETENKEDFNKLVEEVLASEENTEQEEENYENSGLGSNTNDSQQGSSKNYEQALCGNMNAEFVKKLYSRMIYKESWMVKGNRRFDFYLKNIIRLLEIERASDGDKKVGNGYMYAKSKSMCILNIGILDIYGNDIYIVDKTPKIKEFKQKNLELVDSKLDLLEIGFSSDEIKQLPEAFDLSKFHKDCIFDANIEDFDFLDNIRMNHIIEERRDRFPDRFKNESVKIMCDKLKEAITLAIKISRTDCRYIVPKYDFERKKIQFMIPFHLDNGLDEPPELAIIVGKQKNIWCIHTIISIEDAIADARILFRTKSWLREE